MDGWRVGPKRIEVPLRFTKKDGFPFKPSSEEPSHGASSILGALYPFVSIEGGSSC